MLLHADADAFFASVELRDRPELGEVPMAVAIHVVVSATYRARAFGVAGGMPVEAARRRCPELVVVSPSHAAYGRAGEQLMALFARFARRVEPGSMEEAFLDVGDRDPAATARELRTAAREELGLPVTVGVARTRLLAKLASRRAKPDGLLIIDDAAERAIRAELTLADTWGVGERTVDRLAGHGVHRVVDLAGWDEDRLAAVAGLAMARRLLAIRDGVDDDQVHLQAPRTMVSASRSTRPRIEPEAIAEHHDRVCTAALARLAPDVLVRRVEVGVRRRDGAIRTERTTLPRATRDEAELRRAAGVLLRLTGVLNGPQTAIGGITLIQVGFGLAGVASSREQDLLPLTDDRAPSVH